MAPPTSSDNASHLDIDWDGTPLARSPWLVVLPDRESVSKHRALWEVLFSFVAGLPTLHCLSAADANHPAELGEELASYFEPHAELSWHSAGRRPAADGERRVCSDGGTTRLGARG